jgi:hypothetical protein
MSIVKAPLMKAILRRNCERRASSNTRVGESVILAVSILTVTTVPQTLMATMDRLTPDPSAAKVFFRLDATKCDESESPKNPVSMTMRQ